MNFYNLDLSISKVANYWCPYIETLDRAKNPQHDQNISKHDKIKGYIYSANLQRYMKVSFT